MADPFIAEIRIFGFAFAPQDWAFCNGQQVPVQQNAALYALVGTTYGGNGQTVFNLPNLQGRAACASGQGPGLTNRTLGAPFGTPTVTLQTTQIPTHTHSFTTLAGTAAQTTNAPAAGNHLGYTVKQRDFTTTLTTDTTLAPQMVGPTGQSLPHANQQPYLAMNFCIALQGIYPPRP